MISDDDKKSTDDNRSRDLPAGKLLVWARERANLTQVDVAKELYMTLAKVKALELDDYRHMGADTFVRGYLRAYANLVHLDAAQVLAAYDRQQQKLGVAASPVLQRTASTSKPVWQFALYIFIALVVLWLISIWFFDNRQPPVIDRPIAASPQLDMHSPLTHAAVSSVAVGADVPGSINAELIAANTAAVGSSTSNAPVTASSVAAKIDPTATVTAPALSVIRLGFTAESWVEISDARGDVLAADLRAAGANLQLQGEAPFDVLLGNAAAVSIELNGQPVAITPSPTTNVLSLKVGQ